MKVCLCMCVCVLGGGCYEDTWDQLFERESVVDWGRLWWQMVISVSQTFSEFGSDLVFQSESLKPRLTGGRTVNGQRQWWESALLRKQKQKQPWFTRKSVHARLCQPDCSKPVVPSLSATAGPPVATVSTNVHVSRKQNIPPAGTSARPTPTDSKKVAPSFYWRCPRNKPFSGKFLVLIIYYKWL